MPAFDVRQVGWPAWQLQFMKRLEKLLHFSHCFLPDLLLFMIGCLLPELSNALGVRVEQGHCCFPQDHPQVSCLVFRGQLWWGHCWELLLAREELAESTSRLFHIVIRVQPWELLFLGLASLGSVI